MTSNRRWYDRDPDLKEAMDVLSLSPNDFKDMAPEFIVQLQEEMAAEVIEKVYQTVKKYQGTGNRWYDNDPVTLRAIELLRVAPPNVQRLAAKKLLKSFNREDILE